VALKNGGAQKGRYNVTVAARRVTGVLDGAALTLPVRVDDADGDGAAVRVRVSGEGAPLVEAAAEGDAVGGAPDEALAPAEAEAEDDAEADPEGRALREGEGEGDAEPVYAAEREGEPLPAPPTVARARAEEPRVAEVSGEYDDGGGAEGDGGALREA
jgi:hypothetical protein